jgi:hypothetical protein
MRKQAAVHCGSYGAPVCFFMFNKALLNAIVLYLLFAPMMDDLSIKTRDPNRFKRKNPTP